MWTKLSTPHLMEVGLAPGVVFAASQEGGYIFPSFLPAYDAHATLVHLLALLAQTGCGCRGGRPAARSTSPTRPW